MAARICSGIARILGFATGALIVCGLLWRLVVGAGTEGAGIGALTVWASLWALVVGMPCGVLASFRTHRRSDVVATVLCLVCFPLAICIMRGLAGGR